MNSISLMLVTFGGVLFVAIVCRFYYLLFDLQRRIVSLESESHRVGFLLEDIIDVNMSVIETRLDKLELKVQELITDIEGF